MLDNKILPRNRAIELADLKRRSEWIRLQTIRLVEIARSGHYSSVFSCAEMLAVLYYKILRLNPNDAAWPDRDRFLLGKGHVAIGLYPCLSDLGFFPAEWLDRYTKLGSTLGDHPDMKKVPGIDFSSGSIGHNLSVGVGMALAAKAKKSDALIWVMLGDQELNEGQIWEAAMAASHFKLNNLIAIVDANGWGLDGRVGDVMAIEPVAAKFDSFGWSTEEIDGHDVGAVADAFTKAQVASGPHLVLARTMKGKGVSFMEQTPFWHLGYLGPADREIAIAEIEERIAAL
jgi:transketolase